MGVVFAPHFDITSQWVCLGDVQTRRAIVQLNLGHNAIADAGAAALGAALRVNKSLEMLVLTDNQIQCAGGSALLEALATSVTQLRHLGLDNNRLGVDAVASLGAVLASGSLALSQLELEANGFGDEAKEFLREAAPSTLRLSL